MNTNFIMEIIENDLNKGVYSRVHTRFPPEPNGYLHIGHAKSIYINFGLANFYNGLCNLRFDDTNPSKEETEYVESIKDNIKWLGYDWEDRLYFASDYFDDIFQSAVKLIKMGRAYVCDLSAEEIREYRGTLTQPGKNSPFRERSIEENITIFENMKEGMYDNGSRVLRAKIDMTSPNLNMRDPVIYRIQKTDHHRTGSKWCIYPMYDFAHPISDAIEKITHSVCTLEFEDHRPLYDWFLKELNFENPPKQIEFARLNLNYTMMSKRKLLTLVREGYVSGWDDPRMPSLSGLRRRGYTPSAIKDFCERIGVAKSNSIVDIGLLEHCIREDLNKNAPRVMAVLKPLKVIIDNYPEDLVEVFDVEINPEDPSAGTRKVEFSRVIFIEQDDFMESPPKKYFRLSPQSEVRLKNTYFIKFNSLVKDENGNITELHVVYDPQTKGGNAPDGRKVKGTIHWVSAHNAVDAQVRLYHSLFNTENPSDTEEGKDFLENLNDNSLEVLENCKIDPCISEDKFETKYQFLRMGYFCRDYDSQPTRLVFNRIVTLKDTWAKISAI